jgi:hypothetical protein
MQENAGASKMGKMPRRALMLNEGDYAIHGEDVPVPQVILKYRRNATPF